MGKYDSMNEVKSVTDFLLEMKGQFDGINASMPEGASKIDFGAFQDGFFKANEGILKNRDKLKDEKAGLSTTLSERDARITNLEKLTSSIDKDLPDKYNQAIEELGTLKGSMKDGKLDIDVFNQQKQSEIDKLNELHASDLIEKLSAKDTELNTYKSSSETFQGLFSEQLRSGNLMDELKRINVNPEDMTLISQAYLSRAEVSKDREDKYGVFYKDDKGDLKSGVEFWDKWAVDKHNQKYILADVNTGGGVRPTRPAANVGERGKMVTAYDEAMKKYDTGAAMDAMEELAKSSKK
jgi:hypothetical protein